MEDIKKKIINEYDFAKITSYINAQRTINQAFDLLMENLEKKGDIIVIGGAIRDIIINKCEPRDIDLIIDTAEDLGDIMEYFSDVYKNRFGGYKLFVEDLELDVWTINTHWAFRENILEESIDNIKYSTFLNFDSVLYNITKEVGNADMFNKAIAKSRLEIMLDDEHIYKNPSMGINIARMLVIKKDWGLNFSERINEYIFEWVKERTNPVYDVWEAQKRHYKKTMISMQMIRNELEKCVEKYKDILDCAEKEKKRIMNLNNYEGP